MASFTIHVDDDSKSTLSSYYNGNKPSKRQVLGDIQNNVSRPFASLKRGTTNENSNIVPSTFIENIKALGIKDKPTPLSEKVVIRSPLKEVNPPYIDENACHSAKDASTNDSVNFVKVSTSCSITFDHKRSLEDEHTNQTINDSKENCPPLSPSNSLGDTDKSSSKDNDENTLSCETPQVSRQELSKTIVDDIFATTYYKEDVLSYLQTREKAFQPSAYYMKRQPEITHSMRTILVDWLVEVGEEYNLCNETIFMAVSLTDRFLSYMAITKAKLQLLGTAAMMAASKFEEIYPPEAGAFIYITDDSYTVTQLIRMERLLLKVLCFDVSCPTTYTFLTLIFSFEKAVTKIFYLAMYIAELTLLEAEPYLQFYPSIIASGCVVLARHCLDCKDIWPATLAKLTGCSLTHLAPIVNHLNKTHQASFTSTHQAIRMKYNSAKYRNVSTIPYRKLVLREP